MRFGTIVLATLVALSIPNPGNAGPHGGGRGGSAPSAPHYNPPQPPHISQAAQPHFNQSNASRSNQFVFPEYHQQSAPYGYRSRSSSNRTTSSRLANVNSAASKKHVKPNVTVGQVGSTRSHVKSTGNPTGQTNAIGSTTPGSSGSSVTSPGITPRNLSAINPSTTAVAIGSPGSPGTSARTIVIGSPSIEYGRIGDEHRHKREYDCDKRDSGLGPNDASVSF